ncbi:cytochrome b561 [Nitrobacteraceae bacterium AZCC 2146]
MLENSHVAPWSFGIRVLHWITFAALVAQLGIAFGWMGGMATMRWLPLHMSLGLTILCVVLIRLGWRAFAHAPRRQGARPLKRLSVLVHTSLYALILAVVITGWMAYRPMPMMPAARLFASMPVPLAPSLAKISAREFSIIHQGLVWALLAMVGLHLMAALTHATILRDGILSGMLFGRSKIKNNQVD